ncbi:ribosomal protein S6 kinase-related protein isoform 8 [Mus musculus]|uniref:ribosomal protein S6 kinase-related protein isoform 8 n=1 Tax=Mus musculus TaxID=10090 RepID=UPI001FD5585C|nr:ribosomal protein S6 kinase-related protein isoform 8 [Mus musculus]
MGAVSCRQGQHTRVSAPQKQGDNIQGHWVQGWKSLWCGMGTIRSGLEELWGLQRHQCLHQELLQPAPLLLEKPQSEWPVPQFISLFLPEFPVRPVREQQELKILGLVAKGSFGTVLKVLDCAQKAVFAVKVVPKVKVLQRDTLRQCKEEVSIQRQINHPFVHSLGDSWQGKQHLFIMCSYCSMDLYSLWSTVGWFPEDSIRLFAAELVLVLCYLHDLGIIHRDVKFPVAAERDHVAMLASVAHCESEIPASINQELSLLLHELLCQNPLHRLRYLHHFQVHPFFRGVAFDPELLQKQPVNFVMEKQDTWPSPLESMSFEDFDYDLESLVHSISIDSY